jgi:hypothetical protein
MIQHKLNTDTNLTQSGPSIDHTPQLPQDARHIAGFLYNCTTKANNVKFMHQSLCNPPISSLLRAIKHNFLKGTSHLCANMVHKYLQPSPATSKGHMKRPWKGLQSTTIKPQKMTQLTTPPPLPPIIVDHPPMPGLIAAANKDSNYSAQLPNLITDVNDKSIANIFCFGAFANKTTGVVYNDCTGDFPFMSLDGNVCFFVMYHY